MNAANLLASKDFGVWATVGFAGLGCIVAFVCAGAVGTALLSERRAIASWQFA